MANMEQKAENEKSFETMMMMAGAAIIARATFNMGGRIVNLVFDKAKRMWYEEKPTPPSFAVETYNMSSSVSLLTSPTGTPDKDKESVQEARDKEMQQQSWVEKEIARLEQQNIDLKQKSEAQGQFILAYSKEKQAGAQLQPTTAQRGKETGEDKLYTSNDPWPPGGLKSYNHDNLQPQRQYNGLQVHDHDHKQLQTNDHVQVPDRTLSNCMRVTFES